MRRVAVGFTFGPVALFMLIMVMIYSRAAHAARSNSDNERQSSKNCKRRHTWALAARPTPMIVATQPAARRRPGGGAVDSSSTAPYVIEGWRQVIVYW